MSELIAKLKDISYELLGIVFPGFIAELFLITWWMTLGQNAPQYTFGLLPELTTQNASEFVKSLTANTGMGIAIPCVVVAYFVGHILHWTSRSASADEETIKSVYSRVWSALCFRILKPNENYDNSLEQLFQAVEKKFRTNGVESLTWQQFFPLAKCYLSANMPTSLVESYQIKYTLHRSITAAAVILFWLSTYALIIGFIFACPFTSNMAFHFGGLAIIEVVSLVLIWGFSDSYAYNWKLFGNMIVSESYSLFFGPAEHERKS